MKKRPCAELAEQRSAYVDGALGHVDRDRLLSHLVGCASCRQDVADLRAVRELISRAPDQHPSTPADLSARLVSIAGSDYDLPVHSRSLRTGSGTLPSERRAARWRVAAAGVAVAASVTLVSATGYLAAPADLATVSDPSGEAEAEFSSALGRSPLHLDSVSALLLTDPAGLATGPEAAGVGPTMPTGDPVSAAQTRALLEGAAAAADSVSFAGDQIFTARTSNQMVTARLRVVNSAGQGSQISVVNLFGGPLLSGFSPVAASTRLTDTGLLSLLERNFDLSGVRDSTVVGRPATMLQASRDGVLASRWWVDDATGLVLWQDTYDSAGVLQLSVGFTAMRVTSPGAIEHLPPRTVSTTNTALTLSNAEPLAAAGWFCEPELAGLSLVKLRADRSNDPNALHLTYSDGLHTVTVYEQRGRLGADPTTYGWDAGLDAYLRRGSSNLATWQSGDRVFTVMTDGSPEQLARAVAVLPHQAPHERTTMERIQAGWAKILAEVRG